MHRHARHAVIAAAIAAVIVGPAAGWYAVSGPGSAGSGVVAGARQQVSDLSPPLVDPVNHSAGRNTATPSAHPKPRAAATVRPAPSTSRAATTAAPFRFPVPVTVGNARQIITVRAQGSYASVAAWELRGSTWHLVLQTGYARVGSNGVVPGSTRMQGTDTTPAGTYTLTQAFGIAADPGTAIPYHHVTPDDWWVEDNLSPYYNQMRTASQGGFSTTLPPSSVNGSERLITYPTQYQYVVVIDFNRWPAVRYRGAGIFLHVNGSGSTAGCVSVPLSTMVAILRWLNPAAHPRIAIAAG